MKEQIGDTNNLDYASTLETVAVTDHCQQNYHEAIENSKRAIEVKERKLGKDCFYCSFNYGTIGMIY